MKFQGFSVILTFLFLIVINSIWTKNIEMSGFKIFHFFTNFGHVVCFVKHISFIWKWWEWDFKIILSFDVMIVFYNQIIVNKICIFTISLLFFVPRTCWSNVFCLGAFKSSTNFTWPKSLYLTILLFTICSNYSQNVFFTTQISNKNFCFYTSDGCDSTFLTQMFLFLVLGKVSNKSFDVSIHMLMNYAEE